MSSKMPIPETYAPLTIESVTYDLSHLSAFHTAIPGKGVEGQADLCVQVVFSNHVFTERAKHGHPHHLTDHHNTKRVFDGKRYAFSQGLPGILRQLIEHNELTFISTSYGGQDNLAFVKDNNGIVWTVVFCLHPIRPRTGVRMEVLSAHPKVINQRKIARKHLSFYARKCLYEQARIPKN